MDYKREEKTLIESFTSILQRDDGVAVCGWLPVRIMVLANRRYMNGKVSPGERGHSRRLPGYRPCLFLIGSDVLRTDSPRDRGRAAPLPPNLFFSMTRSTSGLTQ